VGEPAMSLETIVVILLIVFLILVIAGMVRR